MDERTLTAHTTPIDEHFSRQFGIQSMSHAFSTAHCAHCSHSIKCMLVQCGRKQRYTSRTQYIVYNNIEITRVRVGASGRALGESGYGSVGRRWERAAMDGEPYPLICVISVSLFSSLSVSFWIFWNGPCHVVVVVIAVVVIDHCTATATAQYLQSCVSLQHVRRWCTMFLRTIVQH